MKYLSVQLKHFTLCLQRGLPDKEAELLNASAARAIFNDNPPPRVVLRKSISCGNCPLAGALLTLPRGKTILGPSLLTSINAN